MRHTVSNGEIIDKKRKKALKLVNRRIFGRTAVVTGRRLKRGMNGVGIGILLAY